MRDHHNNTEAHNEHGHNIDYDHHCNDDLRNDHYDCDYYDENRDVAGADRATASGNRGNALRSGYSKLRYPICSSTTT